MEKTIDNTKIAGKVFISYCQIDGFEFALNLKHVLEGLGYQSFVSKENMKAYFGSKEKVPSDNRILTFIDECDYFVLILTKNSLNSEFIKKEISRAISSDKIIFPYYKKPDLSSRELKEPFSVNGKQLEQFCTKQELAQNVVTAILGIEHKTLRSYGIKKVFKNRKTKEYADAITECIGGLNGGAVQMLGISLRDWFGEKDGKYPAQYAQVVEQALKNNVQFEVLLVDPTSDIAKERAIVESGLAYKDDKKFIGSPLFQDIKRVATWIRNYEKVERQNSQQPSIEAHFYDFMLSVYAIITPTYTFIEQYHIGAIGGEKAPGDRSAICLGGYVPVFMVDSNSKFGLEICDHFKKILKHSMSEEGSRGNTFENVFCNIRLFEKDPIRFRMQQFAVKTHRRCNNILDAIKKEEKEIIKSNF